MRVNKVEIIWVFGGRLVAAIGVLVSIKIIIQFLTIEEMGVYGLAIAIGNGLSKSAINPLSQPMLRYSGSALLEGDFITLYSSYLRAYFLILLLIIFSFVCIILSGIEIIDTEVLTVAFLIACCLGLQTGNVSVMNSMRWRRATAFSHAFVAWGRGLIAISFMAAFGAEPFIALLGYLCALLLCIFFQTLTILRGSNITLSQVFSEKHNKTEWKSFVGYAAPFFLMLGIDAVAMEIDKAIVAAYFSTAELGAYVAMQMLARMPVFFVVGLIEQLVYPVFFQGHRKANQSDLTAESFRIFGRIYFLVLVSLVSLCAILYIIREPVVHILTIVEYVPYAALLPALMLAGVVSQSSRILQAPVLRSVGSRAFIPAKVVQLFTLVAVMLIAIPAFGLMGVAIAANVASLALVISIIAINLSHLRRRNNAVEHDESL